MAKDMTLLWGSGSPPCWRVMIALEEKNLQGYNQKLLSFEKMEHKSKEVMEMNPRGQLPAFKHGDRVLNESYAACMYLESQFKSQGNKLIPDCPAEQALMYQRMFEGLTFNEKMASVIYYNWKVPEGERHDSAVKRNREVLSAEVKLWEGYLEKRSGCSWQERTFHWLMWSFIQASLISSVLGYVKSVTLKWQLTITALRTDPASKPPGPLPGWRTHRDKTC
ncbi:Glutathione S-transferase A [Larimichthys crocea]|uniref:Glutathione S-transferase A n=1 Tax=Larimichthys crocea TaxID=215358 RepID=A0A6G0HSM0_LARCR|nr:Glutathione S-transferase A [Larimichthys crocea]